MCSPLNGQGVSWTRGKRVKLICAGGHSIEPAPCGNNHHARTIKTPEKITPGVRLVKKNHAGNPFREKNHAAMFGKFTPGEFSLLGSSEFPGEFSGEVSCT